MLLAVGTIEAHWPEDGAKLSRTGESRCKKNGIEGIMRIWTATHAERARLVCG